MNSNLENKVQTLIEMVEDLQREQQKRQELYEDLIPILKSAIQVGSERIEDLESKGYFRLARGLVQISENVAAHYSPDDLNKLAQGIVGILDTIRSLTQPDVLALVDDAVKVVHNSEHIKPTGVRGILSASRDVDVQRGLAILIEVLRQLGSGIQRIKSSSNPSVRSKAPFDKLGALLGPRLRSKAMPSAKGSASMNPAPRPATRTCLTIQVDGIEFTADGFCVHHDKWNEEVAQKIAQAAEIHDLSEQHWKLIRFARQEYLAAKSSPNLRRMSVGSGFPTKEIYLLFPKAPAKTICRIAGIPKPVGCI